MVQGFGVGQIRFCVDPRVVFVDGEPGGSCGEAGVFSGGPLYRGSGVVPAVLGYGFQGLFSGASGVYCHLILIDGIAVIQLFHGVNHLVLHSQFLSLIDEGDASEKEIGGGQGFFGVEVQVLCGDIAGYAAGFVVIFDDIGEESDLAYPFLGLEYALFVILGEAGFAVVPAVYAGAEYRLSEIKHAGEIAAFSDEVREFVVFFIEDFSHGKCVIPGEGAALHFSQEYSDALGVGQHLLYVGISVIAVGIIVFKGVRFLDIDDRVNPETAQSLFQPPVDVPVDLFSHLRVLPVEIRLFFMENMQVHLIRVAGEFLPAGAAEV